MPASEEIIDLLAEAPNVLTFTPSDNARDRVWELIDREKSGTLSEDEKYELDHYAQMEHLMRLVKARARRQLHIGS
jgi:hypothetical protein